MIGTSERALLRAGFISVVVFALAACGSSKPPENTGSGALPEPPELRDETIDDELQPLMLDTQLRGCDFMAEDYCLFPWPNNFFTTADSSTDTGRRVNLNTLGMPSNLAALPLRPTEWNRNDGFSPGQMLVTHVPGLDLAVTGANNITDIEASLQADAPIFIIDAETGERHPIWIEIDASETAQTLCETPGSLLEVVDLVGGLFGFDGALDPLLPILDGVGAGCDTGLQPILAALGEVLGDGALGLSNALKVDPPALLMRPGVNFRDGRRYIVAMRNLLDADGNPIEAPAGFRVYRDRFSSELAPVNERRAQMEDIIGRLVQHGVERESLYMAWDFTVASTRNIAGRVLHMRDTALADLGDAAPAFEITEIIDSPSAASARRVFGRFTVPNFLTLPDGICDNLLPPVSQNVLDYCDAIDGLAGQLNQNDLPLISDILGPVSDALGLVSDFAQLPFSRLYYANSDDELPSINPLMPTQEFLFQCEIPRTAVGSFDDPDTWVRAATPTLYGHGLLGGKGEVGGGSTARLREQNLLHCAIDWIGMASRDVPSVVTFLVDMSFFPTLPDRVQQGIVNWHYLTRLLNHPQGFAAHPAFQTADGRPVFSTEKVVYDGNSQGGIIGGVVMATSTEITRGSLGVPGMNYSTLLRRSVDFDAYGALLYLTYPNSFDQSFILSFIQMLWDRAETNGYANHLTRPDAFTALGHPTPDHEVILNVAFGDHQVADVTAEIMSRSWDGAVHLPGVEPGRHSNVNPYWGIRQASDGESGSVMIIWDIGDLDNDFNPGTPTSPIDNIPPRIGRDPHSDPRAEVAGGIQRAKFLLEDRYLNVCGDRPCFARDYVSADVANRAVGNLAPFVRTPGPVVASPGTQVLLAGIVADPDRDPLSLNWSIVSGGACVAGLEDATQASTQLSLEPGCTGTVRARLTATDGRGGSGSDEVVIQVQ
jgi:hypothetical protein